MSALTILAELLHRRSGLVVGPDKLYLLESRLAPLIQREGLTDLDALASRLGSGGCAELERDVAEAMATHETMFFRDAKPFEHLLATGLPTLLHDRPPGATLRMWSAAASSGQEAYSMAMAALESGVAERYRVEVLGTDFARDPLNRAQAGCYTQYEVQRGLSVHRLLRHFSRQGHQWRVNPNVRGLCSFRELNLLDDLAPLGRFDVVFCRNVLFYFDMPTRSRILTTILRQMAPGGLLYLGAAETATGLADTLEREGPSYTAANCRPPHQADQPV